MNKFPEILYKYRAFSHRALNMLAYNQVYFAHPLSFNDPFDCSAQEYMHDNFREDMAKALASLELQIAPELLTREQIQSVRERFNLHPEMIESERDSQDAMDKLRERLGILSLSARNDSILMWSHYAKMHRGFCVGYLINNFGVPIEEFREVLYSRTRNLSFAFNVISNPNKTIEMFEEEFWREYVLTKYIDWQYEQEWRFIGQARSISQYPDEGIDRIIFGLKMPQEHRDQIRSIVNGKNVNFFEVKKSADAFALEIIRIEHSE